MTMKSITVQRTGPALQPDRNRVLIRLFLPGDETGAARPGRAARCDLS